MKTKVVVMGGGTGNFTVLSGLKFYKSLDLSAVVSMVDDGGSTGMLRNEFGILPPGDVRQCMIAMSEESELVQKLFQYRFKGSLGNHNFGNLFHLALSEITGSDERAILEMSRILKIGGRVVPVTLENIRLQAELEDGTVIFGETNIDLPKHNPDLRIQTLQVNPSARPNPKALSAIQAAECIIVSPGDLFTSTLPNFLVNDIARAFSESAALKIYVCNLMTKRGETTGFTALDHVRSLHQYIGKNCIDVVIVNSLAIADARMEEYAKEHSHPVAYTVPSLLEEGVQMVVESEVASAHSLIRHDSNKIAWEIFKLIQEHRHRFGQPSKTSIRS